MQTEETNTLQELEELRSQYNDLKKEVDKQQIINDRLLKASMKNDLRFVSRKKWLALVVGIVIIPGLWFICQDLGLRLYFYILTVVFVVVMVASSFISNNTPNAEDLSGQNTMDFVKALKKSKESHFRHFRIFYPASIIWVGLFIGEVLHSGLSDVLYVIIGIALGAIIGSLLGIRTHNRIIGIYEGLILQMENKDLYINTLK